MDAKLHEVLNGQEQNHLLPFLWMHNNKRAILPELVQQVYDSGARAFCVESRPHNHFCEEEWWGDMDVLLKEARDRDMQVWILDDKHFPTGYANGLIEKKYPERRRWQLVEEHVDVVGPARDSAILLNNRQEASDECSDGCAAATEVSDPEDQLLGVFAYRRNEAEETLDDAPIDLTGKVFGNYVFWDVPQGVYRIFAIYKSRRGGGRKDYLQAIDPDSVHVLIEAVYEPHYEHYKEYFGNTIAGFFSDEPSLGNTRILGGGNTPGGYYQQLGQPGLALPWSDELFRRLNQKMGRNVAGELAGLWYKKGDGLPELRVAYMDVLTELWRENFSLQLGEWCRAHGVMYIGHIIEDMNAHARLSCSGGHYFRSLDGQDMAGIDVVLHQIMPGLSQHKHVASGAGGIADPEFYDYVLAKLASSHAHIQPRMKGRAMCEVFGAYGWAEGVPLMKYLMDHMLVRGINYFVPHAFSPDYPDPDCPPHFNAGGHNPQFSAFAKLMKYTNQVAHLLEDAKPVISAAILYHAEAEWSGRDYMVMDKPAKALCDAQMNYEFVPIDALIHQAKVADGALCVEDMRYPALIVPYAAYLPDYALKRMAELEAEGLRLIFVDGRPEGFKGGVVVALSELAGYMRHLGAVDLRLDKPFVPLRYMHGVRESTHVFMLVNESMSEKFQGEVILPVKGKGVLLDLVGDGVYQVDAPEGRVPLALDFAQSVMLIFDGGEGDGLGEAPRYQRLRELEGAWMLETRRAEGEDAFGEPRRLDALYNLAGPKGDPTFSGWMRYTMEFEADGEERGLDLGLVGETVRANLNGCDLGERICAPYVYDIRRAVRPGLNRLELVVANNLVHAHPDNFSHFVQITPSGLLGPVWLMK